MALKHDPILGTEREVGIIPQLSADPANPKKERAWVLATIGGGSGGGEIKALMGLGMPYLTPDTGGTATYQLSFRTKEGTTKRVTLA